MPTPFPTGPWTGYYLETHRLERGWMHLYLEFENGRIRGEGTDYVGPWTLEGLFDPHNLTCEWAKQYVGRHRVDYFGQGTDEGIRGRWELPGRSSHSFHIWPVSMTHLSQKYLEMDEPRAGGLVPGPVDDPFV